MIKKILILLVLSNLSAIAQSASTNGFDTQSYVGKKGIYAVSYNDKVWKKSDDQTEWDVEFVDNYNLVSVYYKEFDSFFSEKSLKTTIKEQYEDIGKVKDLKIYKKKLNDIEVNYFECKVDYQGSDYIFQGFIYNGIGGAVEIQFGVQKEGLPQYQKLIDEFCLGFGLVK